MPTPLALKLAAAAAVIERAAPWSHLTPELSKEFAAATLETLAEVAAAVDGLGEPARAGIAAGLESAGRSLATLGPGLAELQRKHDALSREVNDLAARVEQLRAAASSAAVPPGPDLRG